MFKTAFQFSRRACFLKNFPIEKIRSFFRILELEQNWFDSFAETFCQLKQNCKLPVHRNNLKKKHFLFSTNLFFSFDVFDKGIFEVSGIIFFCQFCQNCIRRIQRSDLMKFLPFKNLEFYTSLSFWLKSLLTSCWKISARLSKLYFGVQSTFKRTDFLRIVQIFFSFCISIDLASFLSETFRQGFQNCSLRARRSIWGKTFGVRFFLDFSNFFGFEGKTFGLLVTTVRQRCQNCTFCASGTMWGKIVSKSCIRP